MRFQPHKYQTRMIEMIQTGKSVALWAEMGLGKSISTLTGVLPMCLFEGKKVLVLAPKFVAEHTWPEEAKKWDHLRDLRVKVVKGTADQRRASLAEDHDVYVICRNLLPWIAEEYMTKKSNKWAWKSTWPFSVVVIDESSAFKNPSGVWFKTMARLQRSECQIIELTGTPSPRSLEDLWAQIFLLDRGEALHDGIGKFRSRWLVPEKTLNMGGRDIVASYKAKPGAYEEVMERINHMTISLQAEDWLEMPERIDNVIEVDLPPKAMAQYRQVEEEAFLELENQIITGGSPGVVIGKLLQMSNGRVYDEEGGVVEIHSEKLEAVKEMILGQTPMLVFYSYKHDLERILELPGAIELKGAKEIDAWNRGEIKLLVAHPASAGHGLNLQHGGNTILWYGLPYNLEWYQQANARLYRQGQRAKTVVIHHLISSGTVDRQVMKALQRKESNQMDVINAVRYKNDTTTDA